MKNPNIQKSWAENVLEREAVCVCVCKAFPQWLISHTVADFPFLTVTWT